MGQQQLLLVILVTILVGIATVVAINTFGAAADNANVDAVRNDLAQIGAAAQAYYMKPEMMGGGGNSFADVTWEDLGAIPCRLEDESGTAYSNCVSENGTYVLGTGGAGSVTVTVTAFPASSDGYTEDSGSGSASIVATVEPDDIDMAPLTEPG